MENEDQKIENTEETLNTDKPKGKGKGKKGGVSQQVVPEYKGYRNQGLHGGNV